MRLTVRTRLTVAYTSLFLLLLVVLGVSLYGVLSLQLDDAADQELSSRADGIAILLQQQDKEHDSESIPEELQERSDLNGKIEIVQLRNALGTVLFRSPGSGKVALDTVPGALFTWMRLGSRSYRVLRRELHLPQQYILEIAIDRSEYDEALEQLRVLLLLGVPIALGLSFFAGRWMSGRFLRPIQGMTETVREIDDRRLAVRLPLRDTDDELEDLARTLNGMLDRLQEAFDRVGRFTADASHELRTPLALIRGNAELMHLDVTLSPSAETRVKEILSEADRMQALIYSLLELARSDAGEQISFELLDPADLTLRAAEVGRKLAEDQQVRFTVDEPRDIFPVFGSHLALTRALVILLDNAFRHTAPGGEVSLSVRSTAAGCTMQVEDTGCGIELAHLPRIFDRFYRVDEARNRQSGGAGLGLSIAQSIVKAHGGSISVESTLGKGSIFRIDIPSGRD